MIARARHRYLHPCMITNFSAQPLGQSLDELPFNNSDPIITNRPCQEIPPPSQRGQCQVEWARIEERILLQPYLSIIYEN